MSGAGVALLGIGRWGRNHLRVLQEAGALRLAWDPDPEALARVPEALRARGPREVLTHPDVCAAVVATPPRTHYALARELLLHDRDVLVEKPLTLEEEQGTELVRLARTRGRVLMVGHVLLFHPAVRGLAGLCASGELGPLRYVYSNRLNLGTVREEEDILWSFAPHDVSLLLHLGGAWPCRIAAQGGSCLRAGRADVTVTHLEFPGGLRAHLFVSWLHPFKEHRLVAIGERRTAVFTDGPGGGELRLYERGLRGLAEAEPVERGPGTAVAFPRHEPLAQELRHFLGCVGDRSEPESGGRHGLEVLRVLRTAAASLREGGLPLVCEPVEELPV